MTISTLVKSFAAALTAAAIYGAAVVPAGAPPSLPAEEKLAAAILPRL